MTTLSVRIPMTRPATSFLSRLLRGRELKRQRSALARLDPHLLKDIGITQAQAMSEATRPAWDAPAHWLK